MGSKQALWSRGGAAFVQLRAFTSFMPDLSYA